MGLAAGLVGWAVGAPVAVAGEVFTDEAATAETVRSITDSVSTLRGLEARAAVPVFVEDPATMRARMEAEIAKQLDPQTIEGVEATWRLLKLVPDDFDLATSYAAVLESAVGGYFDIEEGRLVLVRRDMKVGGQMSQMLEDMVIAHELVHGLQDQHFDLWSLTRRELNNSDVGLAIQTLVEGDASYAMLYRLPIPVDPDAMQMEQLAPMMAGAGGPSSNPGGTLGNAPRILREPLIFPYLQGLVYVQKVKLRGEGWTEVNKAFSTPPLSTEQVLHPDKYSADGDWPTDLRADTEGWVPGGRLLQQDTMGEMGIRLLLQEHLPGADHAAIAAGWDGDRMFTFRRNGADALLWRLTWDTEADAEAFDAAARALLGVLAPDVSFSRKNTLFSGIKGGAAYGVERNGLDVCLWVGTPKRATKRLRRLAMAIEGVELTRLDQVAPRTDRPQPPAE